MTPQTPYPVLRNLARLSLEQAARHLENTDVDAGAMYEELMQVLQKYAPKSGPATEKEDGKHGD